MLASGAFVSSERKSRIMQAQQAGGNWKFAAGLPRWTPIPVMFAETGEIRLRDRCLALSTSFLLRHFALGDKFSPIKKSNLCTLDGLRPSFKERFSGGYELAQISEGCKC
ncbi:hypothetical protein AVEN_153872-1 [Araneus ventricosus]|uniref:Uncharacterized protein n=1 Tax=Araneus ventricosus TaxID=182803 RepID=A0A4Y2LSR5_ARAVE|nr:hypothetical protein AVEN_153872-1 [Araneus ventricosus]